MELGNITETLIHLYAVYEAYEELEKGSTSRRFWVRNSFLDRNSAGFYELNFEKMKQSDPEMFHKATRMTVETFEVLFNLIKNKLQKNSIRRPIEPRARLFLTLVYLAHGVSRQFLSMTFKMGVSTVAKIALETCSVIWDSLHETFLKLPEESEWKKISVDFQNKLKLPHCVGAIDGKHIAINCPPNSGSLFYNYKGFFSIVLLGVCDANYVFRAVDIGAYGSQSDGGVLQYSNFGKKLFAEHLNLPKDAVLPGSTNLFPYYFVGDAAFPLKSFLMRPYPGTMLDAKKFNFNKRLSRGRVVIENTFGVLTARWRILRAPLQMSEKSAEVIVKGAVVLHNFLRLTEKMYCLENFVDHFEGDDLVEGQWRENVKPLKSCKNMSSNHPKRIAMERREQLKDYLFANC